MFYGGGAFDEELVDRGGGQAVADDFYLGFAAHLGQLFQLPLVEHEVLLAQDPLDEHVEVGVFVEQLLELGAADAFGQARGQDDRASLLDDRQRAGQAFDGLVEGRVQRITGRAGHDDIDRFGAPIDDHAAHELDAFQKRLLHVAGHELERPPLGVDHHVDDEVAAGVPADPGVFLVNGVPSRMPQSALGCSRKSGPCQTFTVSRAAMPGQISFRPPREAGHQVRFDQPGGDLQIGIRRSANRSRSARRAGCRPGRCARRAVGRDDSTIR